MSPANAAAVVLTAAVVLAVLFVVVRFEKLVLKDLAETRDEDLRYLTRQGWMVAIVAIIPIGPLVYLAFGKGPDRFA